MDGIIIIKKEKEYTSHDVVAIVKKTLGEKVGHTGTLDPNATGVLPLLIGKGTKLSKYLINHDKTYEVTLKLGEKTNTADSEGKVIEEKKVNESCFVKENLERVLQFFVGKQEQIPPMYSAIKVKGKKLYEYAREGKTVEIKPRKIEIYKIELIKIDKKERLIVFRVDCSKGTYIRSLCENIAEKLGTVGYMKELNRTRVGQFRIENSITLEELKQNKDEEEYIKQYIITLEDLLKEKKKIQLNTKQKELFLNGVVLSFDELDGIYRIYTQKNTFLGTGTIKEKRLKRDVII
ncbi:MAG: tRNA pseudouridine(55) synthase TruB [Clostridia bacterium]